MWIRSQDLYTLIKCERLSIRQSVSRSHCVIGNECVVLGEYSTEEKALKVLDEIQTSIRTEHEFCTEDVNSNCIGKYFTKEWKEIYQMPQDEEVEV